MTGTSGIAIALVMGIMVGLILVVILFKFANKDKKVKTEYDERQREIRNKGYMIGFYTLIALISLIIVWDVAEIGYPLPEYVFLFAAIIIAVTVVCMYCIWKGVYWGINNDPKRYMIIWVIAIALNLFSVIAAIANGSLLSNDPADALPWFNIIIIAMFVVIGVELLVKFAIDKKNAEED